MSPGLRALASAKRTGNCGQASSFIGGNGGVQAWRRLSDNKTTNQITKPVWGPKKREEKQAAPHDNLGALAVKVVASQ